ncbi:DNA-binding protein [Plesiocystis pacifica SIR-1]|uniref:DNA-binding protein n=1 Tax=Plesiocystis pacifica SIR-1 TaxID=391625 RepID=A6GBP8_9BACT|nr:helix-turn-helix transcriptional regulator [Plesiocystis pacifica]EDM76665.1 DNA-binding protein [Plesiocystis pacifica SIR-1]
MTEGYAIDPKGFGKHLRRLRKTRGLSQEALATRGGLSNDTIRRLEHGTFSPSLNTLVGLATGLGLRLSTILASYEIGMLPVERELADLLVGRDKEEIQTLLKVARILLSEP